jgi:hypothetical protein
MFHRILSKFDEFVNPVPCPLLSVPTCRSRFSFPRFSVAAKARQPHWHIPGLLILDPSLDLGLVTSSAPCPILLCVSQLSPGLGFVRTPSWFWFPVKIFAAGLGLAVAPCLTIVVQIESFLVSILADFGSRTALDFCGGGWASGLVLEAPFPRRKFSRS